MRVLSLIFPSNYPNFAADSIFVFNRILLPQLAPVDPRIEVAVAGPEAMPALHARIRRYTLHTGSDKFAVRFGFDWLALCGIVEDFRPDVVLVNMPEQAGAVSVLVRDRLGLPSLIVSYVHYVPAVVEPGHPEPLVRYEPSMNRHGNGQLLVLRLLEGLCASDLTLVCSDFGMRMLRDLAAAHLGPRVAAPRLAVLAPPVDGSESRPALDVLPSTTPTVVYNHRLYSEYGTTLAFSLLDRLAARCSERFQVLVTNPTAGRGPERRALNGDVDRNLECLAARPFVRIAHFDRRREYFRAMARCWVGLAPYKPNALWSMSVFDLLAVGRPVVAFDLAAFIEMGLPDGHVVTSSEECVDRLEQILCEPFDGSRGAELRSLALRHSGRRTARRFLQLVESVGSASTGSGRRC